MKNPNDHQSLMITDVYNEIKQRVLSLQYKPGRGLSTASLAKELQISRAPIREALLRLSTEKFVEMFPKSGSRVSLIDLDQTNDERFLRISTELYAIQSFVLNRTNDNLKEMYQYVEKQKESAKSSNYLELLRYDDLFHKVIFKGIGRLDAWNFVHDYLPNDTRIRLLTFALVEKSLEPIIENHIDIINAAEQRDVKLAGKIMEMHLTRSEADLSKITFQLPEIFKSRQSPDNFENIRTYPEGVDEYFGTLLAKKSGF